MAYAGKNGYDKDTDILFPIATNIIGWVGKADREEILDLSFERISLYQVGKILEKLGYQNIDMSENGWEMDYWWEGSTNLPITPMIFQTFLIEFKLKEVAQRAQ